MIIKIVASDCGPGATNPDRSVHSCSYLSLKNTTLFADSGRKKKTLELSTEIADFEVSVIKTPTLLSKTRFFYVIWYKAPLFYVKATTIDSREVTRRSVSLPNFVTIRRTHLSISFKIFSWIRTTKFKMHAMECCDFMKDFVSPSGLFVPAHWPWQARGGQSWQLIVSLSSPSAMTIDSRFSG